jgi:pyridoxamine 5'-phosphate oxidase
LQTAGLAVSSRWARVKMTPAAHDYLSPLPPGSPLDQPIIERGGREHFAVVMATVTSIDWLELHAQGHRRALFDGRGRRWLVP